MYRLRTSLTEIHFINTNIQTINTEAFDVTNIDSIIFENCTIGVIQNRASPEKVCFFFLYIFSKQFLIHFFFFQLLGKHLEISNCSIGTIESDAFIGNGITAVIIKGNRYLFSFNF